MDKFQKDSAADTGVNADSNQRNSTSYIRELYALVFKYFPDIYDNTITDTDQISRNGGSRHPLFHQIWGDWNVSQLYELVSFAKQHFSKNGGQVYPIEIKDLDTHSKADILSALRSLKDLQTSANQVSGYDSRLWKGCHTENLTSAQISQICESLEIILDSMTDLQSSLSQMQSLIPLCAPQTLHDTGDWIRFLRLVVDSPPQPRPNLAHPAWQNGAQDVYLLIDKVAAFHMQFPDLEQRFRRRALSRNIRTLYENVLGQKKVFDKNRERLKQKLSYVFRGEVPKKRQEILSELMRLMPVWSLYNEIAWSKAFGIELFGALWEGIDSDVMALRMTADWATHMIHFNRAPFSHVDIEAVRKRVSMSELKESIIHLDQARKKINRELERLCTLCHITDDSSWIAEESHIPLQDFEQNIQNRVEHISELAEWSRFIQRKKRCNQNMAKPFVQAMENGSISPDDLVANFIMNLTRATFGGKSNG
ncbi:hypothetical protein GF406_05810 [candidate division KSB1 bacterium]|nr:hypothetical protein [candidate division KSB1 bacterium]